MKRNIVGESISLYRTDPKKKTVTIDNGNGLMQWRKNHHISRPLFAQMADCSERSIASYEKSETIPPQAKRSIQETVRLVTALLELAGDEKALKPWLQAANPAFDERTPLDLIQAGEGDRLWEMVFQLRQGTFA